MLEPTLAPFMAAQADDPISALRSLILQDTNLKSWLTADRIQPGVIGPRSEPMWPYVVANLPGSNPKQQSDRVVWTDTVILVSTYSIGWDTTWFVGQYLDTWLLSGKNAFIIHGAGYTLLSAGQVVMARENQRDEAGGDVWHHSARYSVSLIKQVQV